MTHIGGCSLYYLVSDFYIEPSYNLWLILEAEP